MIPFQDNREGINLILKTFDRICNSLWISRGLFIAVYAKEQLALILTKIISELNCFLFVLC